jgi:hypothetical protein
VTCRAAAGRVRDEGFAGNGEEGEGEEECGKTNAKRAVKATMWLRA